MRKERVRNRSRGPGFKETFEILGDNAKKVKLEDIARVADIG